MDISHLELIKLRNELSNLTARLTELLGEVEDPRLPILAEWLPTKYERRASKLYYLIQVEMKYRKLPVPDTREAAQLLESLGYRRVRTPLAVMWEDPKPPAEASA